jgi:hypothetical protein
MFAAPRRFTAFALLAAIVVCAPLPALAVDATAAQNVNVRSGPASTFGVVAQLQRGDTVDISKCQGTFCYISFGNGKGWVSANYLTRDSVPKAPENVVPSAPQIIATAKPNLPKAGVTIEPPQTHIASAAPQLPMAGGQPARSFPPAYNGAVPNNATTGSVNLPYAGAPHSAPSDNADQGYANVQNSDTQNLGGPNSGYRDPGYGDDNTPAYASNDDGQDVTGQDSAGPDESDARGVPRPKADIPNVAPDGPVGDVAVMPGNVPEAAIPDDNAGPSDDWALGPRAAWHDHGPAGRLASLDGRDRACFFSDGGSRFCMGAGQSRDQFGNWNDRVASIQNPRGLKVTICSTGDARDCHVYTSSGPVLLPGDATIASISVDPPAGY